MPEAPHPLDQFHSHREQKVSPREPNFCHFVVYCFAVYCFRGAMGSRSWQSKNSGFKSPVDVQIQNSGGSARFFSSRLPLAVCRTSVESALQCQTVLLLCFCTFSFCHILTLNSTAMILIFLRGQKRAQTVLDQRPHEGTHLHNNRLT